MSRAIVVMMKMVAKPRGLANVNFGSVRLTVSLLERGWRMLK